MKVRIYIVLVFSIVFSSLSFACSCLGPVTFCGYINFRYNNSDLIVKGKKIRNVQHGFEFQITETFMGVEPNETIMVWGDQGALCRYFNSRFFDGEEYYMALNILHEENSAYSPIGPFEQNGDYEISSCGKTFWHALDAQINEETKLQVETCLSEKFPENERETIATFNEDFCDIETSDPYPNPTSWRIFVNIIEAQNLTVGTARIYDSCGKLVQQSSQLSEFYTSETCFFDVSNLAAGLYFLDINLPELCESNYTKRILVTN